MVQIVYDTRRKVIDSTLLIFAIGAIGSYFDSRSTQVELGRRVAALEKTYADISVTLPTKGDIQRLEIRIDGIHNLLSNRSGR